MQIHTSQILHLLILLLLCTAIASLEAPTLANPDPPALIIEYIPQFQIIPNDLKNAINNQFKTITTATVSTDSVTIDQAFCKLTYRNGSVPVYQTPLRVHVTNDTFGVNCSFQATVKHLTNTKNYSCFGLSSDIRVNYTKEVDFASDKTLITSLSSSYSADSFKSGASCSGKQSDKDKAKINEALSSTSTHSVYLELKKTLDKMKEVFQENVATQHLSQLYLENPYLYEYYDYKLPINVTTVAAQKFKDSGVVNKMQGTVPSASKFPAAAPTYEQGCYLFFAKEFIQNLLDYSLLSFKGWTHVQAHRNNMRLDSFRFRLVDYEFIVPNLLRKFPQHYLADTLISCDIRDTRNLTILPNALALQARWTCLGTFEPLPGKPYTFLNFEPILGYEVQIRTSSQSLSVYSKPTRLIDLSFTPVDDNTVEDLTQAKYVIERLLFEFQTYTVGTFMKVRQNSSFVRLTQQGIWIG